MLVVAEWEGLVVETHPALGHDITLGVHELWFCCFLWIDCTNYYTVKGFKAKKNLIKYAGWSDLQFSY